MVILNIKGLRRSNGIYEGLRASLKLMEVLVPLVDGFEEIEAIAIVDVLRRAGLKVTTAGMPSTMVQGSHGIQVVADKKFDALNFREYDALVLPGGPGHAIMAKSEKMLGLIADFDSRGKVIGAICAAPMVLAKAGILNDKKATIYPGMEREIQRPRPDKVVVDGNVIKSQGPGTAIEFALKLVEKLVSRDKSNQLKKELVHEVYL